MKILHTSDWHLGRSLYGRKRYDEYQAFLDWLVATIRHYDIDLLLVAGDLFDSSTPSNRAQALYYDFLRQVVATSCRHVVIIAGNHDSPSFLNAPRGLLKAFNVHLVGSVSDNPLDEVLVLRDGQARPELIVCAVPYLRDRDIRMAEAGESIEQKEQKLIAGIRGHYQRVAALAEQRRTEYGAHLPIVAIGHLFTAGAVTVDGDGVRELYVGSLAHLSAGIFPGCIDYLALGHLHVPQRVGGVENMRYSGSPLAIGFGEAQQRKSLCLVEFERTQASVQLIEVPRFQELERICGEWEQIAGRIGELAVNGSHAWLEIVYQGDALIDGLRERLDALIDGTEMEILRVRNRSIVEHLIGQHRVGETLDELDEYEVFERCLAAHQVPAAARPELLRCYRETLTLMHDEDQRAE